MPMVGITRLDGERLRFDTEEGKPLFWDLRQVVSSDRVAGELHVEIRSEPHPAPALLLIVEDPDFEEMLDSRRRLVTTGGVATLQLQFKRIGIVGLILLLVVVVPLSYFAFTDGSEAAHRLISIEKEKALGELVYKSLMKDLEICEDEALSAFLDRAVDELQETDSPYDCSVTVVRHEEANAFALPGGRIVMYSSLIEKCDSPAGVAGVLAHELAHIEQRHGLRQLLRSLGLLYFAGMVVGAGFEELETAETITEVGALLVSLRYARDHEEEADAIAILKLRRAKRDVGGIADLFKRLSEDHGLAALEHALGWLSTHPVTEDRIAAFEKADKEQSPETQSWLAEGVSWEDYQQACAGPE